MKKRWLLSQKSALFLIIATIITIIGANKSQAKTLTPKNSSLVILKENITISTPLNVSSRNLASKLLKVTLTRYSSSVIVAQVSVGTTIFFIVIVGVILIIVGGVVLIITSFVSIGQDEIGIVEKKFNLNPFHPRLPAGQIIAFNGEVGIQAEILALGKYWKYPSWMYNIKKVPLTKIGKDEIGLVEAKDGNPQKNGQTFGEVVECDDFQNIKAFFDNGGQVGKQRAVLTTGNYGINPEIFKVRRESVTIIEVGKIGLVEAKDGKPLSSGKNFGKRVNCKYFEDPQAFFEQGGNTGKQIDILPPGTYKINIELFEVRQVSQTEIGSEEIGLVEANDGESLNPGQHFGKFVECNNFQNGGEFIRKGGQEGKQRTILKGGTYQINRDLFTVRKVPITKIAPDEIGLVEAREGSPIPQGKSFGKIVPCNHFQDAQAFVDNGGQAGKQLAILTAGTYRIHPEIFNIRKAPVIKIKNGEIGLVRANDGADMSDEQTLGRVVDCDNFQDAQAFFQNGGQEGKQLAILKAGEYQINTDLFTVITTDNAHQHGMNPEQLKVYKVKKDMIGIVTTWTGLTLPNDDEITAGPKIGGHDNYQNGQKFIAGPKIEGHNNYQNGQKFIEAGGYKGLQEEVLLEGEWNLNPWFVKVEQVPMTKIEQEEVGVVISSVGKEYHKDNNIKNTSLDKDEQNDSSYQLVPKGYKGVQKEPLTAGQYPINTRIKTVKLVPTTQIILNWSNEEKHPLNYDSKLHTLKLTSVDGREFGVEFTQMIRIAPEKAPEMICKIGAQAGLNKDLVEIVKDNSGKIERKYPAIRNLVTRVLTKVVGGHFKQDATGKTAIEFQQTISERQGEARLYIEERLKEIGVEGHGTYINAVNLPEDLDRYRQELEDLKQQQEKAKAKSNTIKQQKITEEERGKLVEQQKRTEAQQQLIEAETKSNIAKIEAQTNLETQTVQAQADQLHLETRQKELDIETSRLERISLMEINAFQQRVRELRPELYAQIETQGKWAESLAQMKIKFPQFYSSGGTNSSGDPMSNILQLSQLQYLQTFTNQLSGGNTTPQFPMSPIMGSISAGNETKNFPKPEPRIPLVLLLDTSLSMAGEPINHLNQGITAFQQKVKEDDNLGQYLDVAIATFNSSGRTVQNFVSIDQFVPRQLTPQGTTEMGKGISSALQELNSYKQDYDEQNIQYRKAWLLLIIGSQPTDNWEKAAQLIRQEVEAKQLNFFVVAVQGADMMSLREVAPPNTPPMMLNDLKFQELFQWLTDALKEVCNSQIGSPIRMPSPKEWAKDV